jgi:hypothetical protein
MSVTCGFFDSVGGDRKYNASQLSSLFNGLINDGVFMSIGDTFIVSPSSGMNVSVGTGRAWFNGTWTNNDSELILTIEASELILNRIDAIVIEVNSNADTRSNTIKVLKGTPSSTPVNPTLTTSEFVNQYPLAYI